MIIDNKLIENLLTQVEVHPRKRIYLDLRNLSTRLETTGSDDKSQRMLVVLLSDAKEAIRRHWDSLES